MPDIKIYFQRSWNLYKRRYGTLSLLIYSPQKEVRLYNLFHWRAEFQALHEVEFRQKILNKLSPPPWKGLKGYLTRAAYARWDNTYPTRVRLYNPSKFVLFVGRLVGEYCMKKY